MKYRIVLSLLMIVLTACVDDSSGHSNLQLKKQSYVDADIVIAYPEIINSPYVEGAAYPTNILFTTNIDMQKAIKIRLSDVININNEFIDAFRKGKYKPYDSELNGSVEAEMELTNYSNERLVQYFNKSDQLNPNNELNVYTCFTKGATGISVGVPHAIGDHVEFEIPYKDIKKYIVDHNDPIWYGLLSK
jgi:hypothetical protein